VVFLLNGSEITMLRRSELFNAGEARRLIRESDRLIRGGAKLRASSWQILAHAHELMNKSEVMVAARNLRK
jgi:hypothetical protein